MRSFFWYRSVTFKFTASLTMCAVVVTMIAAYANIKMRHQEYIDDAVIWSNNLSATVKDATRQAMMGDRTHEIQSVVTAIGAQQWIERVNIINHKGTIAYSSLEAGVGKQLDKESRDCRACHNSEEPLTALPGTGEPRILTGEDGTNRLLSSLVPVVNEPDCYNAACHVHDPSEQVLGVIDVIIPLEDLSRRIASGSTRLIMLSITSIVTIVMLTSLLARRQIVRPIQLLLDGTEEVAEGRFDRTIPVQSEDEIGALSQAFNRMTRELQSHVDDLRRWVVTLEDKVKERTGELEEANLRLVQQEKMASLGRLSAGVAHEINNPLTSILLFSTMIQDKIDADHADYKKISTMVKETLRCREIVDRLLTFSRQDEPRKEKKNLNEILEGAVELLENHVIFQNIQVHMRLAKDLPEVFIDANQMQQVFFNIMINAADAMPDGGGLYIRTFFEPFLEGRYVICEIKDTGKGIPEEHISSLFDPFFSTKAKGTGLGLSICYGIIKRHGGKIGVESKKDAGSTFTIKLPLT